ncbi:hypothetical protein J6590_090422 [Homalodisca vitripennis]|nr:hypothetical protein J6590_090422 [Homalodisca vitripennis]
MNHRINTIESGYKALIEQWNVQGILHKIDEVKYLNNRFEVDILCLCEHWLAKNEIADIRVPGYDLASAYCRSSGRRGCVAIYTKSGRVGVEVPDLVEPSIEGTCEIAAIYIQEFVTVGDGFFGSNVSPRRTRLVPACTMKTVERP